MTDIRWFPMRVTYNRELKVKSELDDLGIENFIPMQYKIVDTRDGRRRQLVPAIHNLIFVRSAQTELSALKMTRKELEPLRYMHRVRTDTGRSEILWIPDREMENFLLVARKEDDSIRFLDYDSLMFCRCGGNHCAYSAQQTGCGEDRRCCRRCHHFCPSQFLRGSVIV